MTYIIICTALYLVSVLAFWSLCAITKGSFAGSRNGIENAEVKRGMFGIMFKAIGTKAYNIQSLYSKDFVLPEDSGLKYKFRDPLPSFEEGYIDYPIAPDSRSHRLSPEDGNAVEHR